MTVIVAGGGIGGLTLALSLHQVGIPCLVLESVDEIRPIGVGINLLPHAVRELVELGLEDQLAASAIETEGLAYYSKHGQLIWREPRGRAAGYRWPQFSIHRGAFQMLLLDAVKERLGADVVRTGAHVAGWRDDGDGVEVDVVDRVGGTPVATHRGRLLVAADGIHSVIRHKLYPDEGLPIWNGAILWRGVAEGPPFLGGRTMVIAGHARQKFVCYPISRAALDKGRSLTNFVAELKFNADYQWRREDWNRPGKLAEFLPAFESWNFDWLDVPATITSAERVLEYPMVDRDPLPRWTHGRQTLLGDAAHPMYPIGSNGASQAILDARVLTRELLARGLTTTALEAYEAERRLATAAIVTANRGYGPEQAMQLVEARAPDGFENILDVLTQDELDEASAGYKRIAGFDKDMLNARPPIVASPARS